MLHRPCPGEWGPKAPRRLSVRGFGLCCCVVQKHRSVLVAENVKRRSSVVRGAWG